MDLASKAYEGRGAFLDDDVVFYSMDNKEYHPNYFLLDFDDSLFVVIRGSGSDEDWATDFDFNETVQTYGKYKINSHIGFYKASKNIFEEMKPTLLKYAHKRIFITGHSLGGSITTDLLVMMLTDEDTKHLDAYAIAFAPAPALAPIPEFINERLVSIVNNADIVPTLCIPALYNVVEPAIPKFGVPRIFMKIIFKIVLTAVKENGVAFGEKLYNASMNAIDVIVDNLDNYYDDPTSLKLKHIGGTIYKLTHGSVLSESVTPPEEVENLSISLSCVTDHNSDNYIQMLNTVTD
jgi:hypothetical protein